MAPAHQRLEAREPATLQVHDRLIGYRELLAFEGPPKVGLQAEEGHRPLMHPRIEYLAAPPAASFRSRQGGVRVPEGFLRPLVSREAHRDPDAGAREHVLAFEIERAMQLLLDAARHPGGVGSVVDFLQQHGELVAAKARHRVLGTEAAGDPAPDVPQELVAHGVAQALVDELEAIQVDHQRGEGVARLPLHPLDRAAEPVQEERPVGQPGQHVVQGVMAELRLEVLAVRDVGLGPHEARRPPGLVAHRQAPAGHPPVAPVAVAQPVLALEAGGEPFEVGDDGHAEAVPVVGMGPREPFARTASDLGLRVPQHLLPARGETNLMGNEVPVPEAVVRAASGEGVALLAPAQRGLGPLALLAGVRRRVGPPLTADLGEPEVVHEDQRVDS